MVSQNFMEIYFMTTYAWFCVGFLIIAIVGLKNIIGMIKGTKRKEK